MATAKISISLSHSALRIIEHFAEAHGLRSRSQVIERALRELCEKNLEQSYREASAELDPAWEATSLDGLTHEPR